MGVRKAHVCLGLGVKGWPVYREEWEQDLRCAFGWDLGKGKEAGERH